MLPHIYHWPVKFVHGNSMPNERGQKSLSASPGTSHINSLLSFLTSVGCLGSCHPLQTIWECKAKQHSLMTKYIYFDQHSSTQTLELGLKQDVSHLATSILELHEGFQTTSSSIQSSSNLCFHCISMQH